MKMRCDQCQSVIEEYFDGELESRTALEISQHLEGCASCANLLRNLSDEHQAYSTYEPQVEITPQLWAAIERRIATKKPVRPTELVPWLRAWMRNAVTLPPVSGPAAVGLVVLAVALTVLVMRFVSEPNRDLPERSASNQSLEVTRSPRDERTASTTEGGTPSLKDANAETKESKSLRVTTASDRKVRVAASTGPPKPKTPGQLVREAEQKYMAAIEMLSRDVNRRKSRLDPTTLAELNQALASIDQTIAATRKAVRQHPDDPVAAQYMLTAYARKVGLLREIVED